MRRYTAQSLGVHKSPAGQTQRSAGAGGGAPLVQAQAPKSSSGGLDAAKIKALGGLLAYMKNKSKTSSDKTDGGWIYRARSIDPKTNAEEILYQGSTPGDVSGFGDNIIYDAVRLGIDEEGKPVIVEQFQPEGGRTGWVGEDGQRTWERGTLPWAWNTNPEDKQSFSLLNPSTWF